MTVRRKLPGLLLFLVLLLSGCGRAETPPSPQSPEPAQNAETAETEPSPRLLPVRSRQEVMTALEAAWDSDEAQPAPCVTVGGGAAEVMATDGDILYIIQRQSVLVFRLGGAEPELLSALPVGEEWTEESGEDFWGGHEKQPAALCALRGRLAVISDCPEYYYTAAEDGSLVFRDHSCCAIDLFDTEEPENIVPMASYGQSGSFACALEKDGLLYLASRRQLFPEDFASDGGDDLPSLRSGENFGKLSWDKMLRLDAGSEWYTLLSAYSPYNGVLADSAALIGGGERMVMDTAGLSLLRGDPAEELFCAFTGGGLGWTVGEEHDASAEVLTDQALRGGDWRSATELPTGPEWSRAWDETREIGLCRTETGLRAVLSRGEEVLTELELGYDFQAAPEEKGVYTDAERGALILPAEDGWGIWRLEDEGFLYIRSLFSPDHSENRRCFLCGETLYCADTCRLFALNAETLEVLGEWTL